MNASGNGPFFVGYLNVPKGLRTFLVAVSFFLLGGFGASALLIDGTQDAPGNAAFRFDWGRQTLTGVLETTPYPIVHVTKGTKRIPAGRTVMLGGNGKRGVQRRARPLNGQLVQISGVALQRGDIQMIQLRGGKNGIRAAKGAAEPAQVTSLGRWRLQGEICDGKCLAGTMRPGRGLSHKACANLCLVNGAPPVFVSATPVEGEEFFLMSTPDGQPFGANLLDHIGRYVSIDGMIEKRGDIHLFKVDLASIKLLN